MKNPIQLSRRTALQLLGAAGAQFLIPGSAFGMGGGGIGHVGASALGAAAYGHMSVHQMLASRMADAFRATTVEEAMEVLTAGHEVRDHTDLHINLPDIAEQGSEVLVQVDAPIPGTEAISILVPSNREPLACVSDVPQRGEAFVSLRLRVGGSTNVIALAHNQGGTIYQAQRKILVTTNGCA